MSTKHLLHRSIIYTICLALAFAPIAAIMRNDTRIYAEQGDETGDSDNESGDQNGESGDSTNNDDDANDQSIDSNADSNDQNDGADDQNDGTGDSEGSGDSQTDRPSNNDRTPPPTITTMSGIVMDLDTGTVLYEKDISAKRYPASIAKIMTALIALENGNPDDIITVSQNAVDSTPADSSNIALMPNEQLSLRDAIFAMLLGSANDAANAIAEHISGSIPEFCAMMNTKAAELGCTNTSFSNASGLTEADNYTCARDMALIGQAAFSRSDLIEYLSTLTYTIPPTNSSDERVLWNGDNMLFETGDYFYSHAVCGKNGYTPESNGTLITLAEKNGTRLISVLMDSTPTEAAYTDTVAILNFCFDYFHKFQPLAGFSFDKEISDSSVLTNYYNNLSHELPNLSTDISYTLYTRNYINADNIEKTVILDNTSDSPVVGRITFSFEGQSLGEVEIINNDYTPQPPPIIVNTDKQSKKVRFEFHWYYLLVVVIIIVLCIILAEVHTLHKKAKRRKKVHSYPVDLPKKEKGLNHEQERTVK